MIYCVVPRALADELYEPLVEYYREDPAVEVIVDRRGGPDRRRGTDPPEGERRETRDRRRRPPTGALPSTDVPE